MPKHWQFGAGTLEDEHPDVAASLNSLATLYRHEGKLTEAEEMAREALRISLKFDTNSLDVADSMRSLVLIMGSRNKWVEAEELARQALERKRKLLPASHHGSPRRWRIMPGHLTRWADLRRRKPSMTRSLSCGENSWVMITQMCLKPKTLSANCSGIEGTSRPPMRC